MVKKIAISGAAISIATVERMLFRPSRLGGSTGVVGNEGLICTGGGV